MQNIRHGPTRVLSVDGDRAVLAARYLPPMPSGPLGVKCNVRDLSRMSPLTPLHEYSLEDSSDTNEDDVFDEAALTDGLARVIRDQARAAEAAGPSLYRQREDSLPQSLDAPRMTRSRATRDAPAA